MKKRIIIWNLIIIILFVIQLEYNPENVCAANKPYEIWDGYKYEACELGIRILEYYGTEEELVIPNWIKGYNVAEIGDGVFENNKTIKSVTVPFLVTRIGKNAFRGCTNLEKVVLESSVIYSIGEEAFEDCYNLKTFESDLDDLTSLKSGVFRNCIKLKELYIPCSLTYIADTALANTPSLKVMADTRSIYFYSDIYRGILYNADQTKIIKVSSNMIGKEYKVADTVTTIGRYAFSGCDIESITLTENITSIGEYAFENCKYLKKIKIPKNTSGIQMNSFWGCEVLENINVDIENEYMSSEDGIVYTKDKEHLQNCPEGKKGLAAISMDTKVLDDLSFRNCSKITQVIIPNGVTTIGRSVFMGCSNLEIVRIPKTVTSIVNEFVFSGCEKITIYCEYGSVAHEYAEKNNIPYVLDYEIRCYTNDSMQQIKLGDSIQVLTALYANNVLKENQGEFTFTFSNPSIASCSNVVSTSTGTTFTITANQVGTTLFTIKDNNTGEEAFTNITVSATGNNILTTNDIPIKLENGEEYNFNFAGMYITDFEKISISDDEDLIKMKVYNEESVIGFVDVYGKDHNFIRSDMIKKFEGTDITSIYDTITKSVYLVQDLVTNGIFSFKNRSRTQETEIEIKVPKDGYIKIGNNCMESKRGLIYNSVDMLSFALLEATGMMDDFSNEVLQQEFSEKILESILEYGADQFIEEVRVTLKKPLLMSNAIDSSEEMINVMIRVCKEMAIDFDKLLREAALEIGCNVAEEVFTELAGPFGVGLEGMFMFAKFMSFSNQMVDTYYSVNKDVLQISVVTAKKTIRLATIKLSGSQYVFNGSEKRPTVTVKCNGNTLKNGVDYELVYINNCNVGEAIVKIIGIGEYTGTVTKQFQIGLEQVKHLRQDGYTSSRIRLSWTGVAGATGYQIYRAPSKNGKYKYINFSGNTVYTQSFLKSASKYYYKVRAYTRVNGKNIYGPFSVSKSMITKPATPKLTLQAGKNKAKIAWSRCAGANGYELYMSTSKNGKYTLIKSARSLQYHYTKTDLTKGKTYYFKVRAFKKTGIGVKVYSESSNTGCIKVK